MVIEVTDPKDPRIAGYVGLKDGARIRDRGQFIAESRPVVLRLLETRADLVESLLMSPHQWANVEEAYGEVPAPVYVADRAVLDAVAGLPPSPGLLGPRPLPRPRPVGPVGGWPELVACHGGHQRPRQRRQPAPHGAGPRRTRRAPNPELRRPAVSKGRTRLDGRRLLLALERGNRGPTCCRDVARTASEPPP